MPQAPRSPIPLFGPPQFNAPDLTPAEREFLMKLRPNTILLVREVAGVIARVRAALVDPTIAVPLDRRLQLLGSDGGRLKTFEDVVVQLVNDFAPGSIPENDLPGGDLQIKADGSLEFVQD